MYQGDLWEDRISDSIECKSCKMEDSSESLRIDLESGPQVVNKRLIVCCDGTWKDSISSESPLTNVARISRLITDIDGVDEIPQVVYYHTGVGSGTSSLGNIVDGISGRGERLL